MNANHSRIIGELSRRDFLAYSSFGVLGTLVSGGELSAPSEWAELNPLFETKLGVKFVLGGMVHETAHEGPCRTGKLENLTYEAETQGFEKQFNRFKEEIKSRKLPREARILDPVDFRVLVKEKDVEFRFEETYFRKIEGDLGNTDLIVVLWGFASDIALKVAERFDKPVATIGNDWVVDVPATLRHKDYESYIALDWEDFANLVRMLWIRKAFSQTKLLIVTDRPGQAPYGLASAIHDYNQLQELYGLQCHRLTNKQLTKEMDSVIGSESERKKATKMARDLIANARTVHMTEEHVVNSVYFYLTVKRLMKRYDCNAFTIECREICPLEIAAKYQFTPCMTLSLLKDQGCPAVCQTDINALIPMAALSYLGRRSVYMGNPVFDAKNNILTIFHDVPGLRMKGFDTTSSPYELRNFTVGGWGVTLRYDFNADKGHIVTIARANPGQTKILITKGEILDGFGLDEIGCSLGVRIKHEDTLRLFRSAADYGGHLVMAYGDYIDPMQDLSRMIGFDLVVV
jgi:L-fucose isomerase-like protein